MTTRVPWTLWEEAAAALAAVCDPVTKARLDGDVAAHILDAVQFVDHPWATSWLRAEGALIAGTLADHHEVPDDVASAYVVAAVYAFIAAETPLTYQPVGDIADAALKEGRGDGKRR